MQHSPVILDLCLKKLCHRNPNYHDVILFKKVRFRDELVWAARPVVKIKVFSNKSGVVRGGT